MPYVSGNVGAVGPPAGSYVPVADKSGVTVDTTTYSNTITGSGKLTTLVFPATTGAIAIAKAGDLFPRIVFTDDPTNGPLEMSDGTVDPTQNGAVVGLGNPNGDGTMVGFIGGNQGNVQAGVVSTNVPVYNASSHPLRVAANFSGVTIFSGTNAPAIGGNVGDLYIRNNPAGDSTYFYRCTTAGTAGNAVWAAITGA